jgi:hypothetical protein
MYEEENGGVLTCHEEFTVRSSRFTVAGRRPQESNGSQQPGLSVSATPARNQQKP